MNIEGYVTEAKAVANTEGNGTGLIWLDEDTCDYQKKEVTYDKRITDFQKSGVWFGKNYDD